MVSNISVFLDGAVNLNDKITAKIVINYIIYTECSEINWIIKPIQTKDWYFSRKKSNFKW